MQKKATATQIKTILFPPEADRGVLEGEDMEARHSEVRPLYFRVTAIFTARSCHCYWEHMKMNGAATCSAIDVEVSHVVREILLISVVSEFDENGSHESGTHQKKVMRF